MATSRRTTRSRNSRGGSGKKSEDGFGGKGIGSLSSKPAKKWISVKRPPAKGVGFEVDVWIPISKLTPEEREKYLPKEETKQVGDTSAAMQPESATPALNQTVFMDSTTAAAQKTKPSSTVEAKQVAVESSGSTETLKRSDGAGSTVEMQQPLGQTLTVTADNLTIPGPFATAIGHDKQQNPYPRANLDEELNAPAPLTVSNDATSQLDVDQLDLEFKQSGTDAEINTTIHPNQQIPNQYTISDASISFEEDPFLLEE